jgi:hypothetical protein
MRDPLSPEKHIIRGCIEDLAREDGFHSHSHVLLDTLSRVTTDEQADRILASWRRRLCSQAAQAPEPEKAQESEPQEQPEPEQAKEPAPAA